jgi:hypothetical protein
LYSTGSETFSAEAAPRPPNSALQNDIAGLPFLAAECYS